ncbi:MAG: ABC transporter permease [Acidobacteria bacterium]|nr:ABC transporter permease [Acidobacteriota bacterium]
MPIHDQGYQRYAGSRARTGTAWQVIARAGIRTVLVERKFLALMLLAWAPFLVRAVQVYVAANYSQASFLQPKGETFREFLETQAVFVFFITIYAGAGLIASDRRANALQLYLAKPLSRWEYVAGKMAVLVTLLIAVTFLPAMMLLLVQIGFAGSFTFVTTNLYLLPAITLYSLAQVLLASSTMLALSSLSKSSRFVGVMYAGLIFFTGALFKAVQGITGASWLAWLSPSDALEQLGDAIFRLPLRYDLPLWLAALVVLGLIAGSGVVLERRVRAVEVVS